MLCWQNAYNIGHLCAQGETKTTNFYSCCVIIKPSGVNLLMFSHIGAEGVTKLAVMYA